jgi:hypothetical protein
MWNIKKIPNFYPAVTDASGPPVKFRCTVTSRSTFEFPSLHHTLEAIIDPKI